MVESTWPGEEIEAWPTPARALDLLPSSWGESLKKNEIARRMQAGTIRCGCMRWKTPKNEHLRVQIAPDMWKGWAYLAHDGSADPFWEGASYEKWVSQDYGRGPDVHIQMFGVRLDPEGIDVLLREAGVTPPHGFGTAAPEVRAKAEQKPLAATERQKFARVYAETFGDAATEAKAVLAVRACYPDNFISRDAFLADFRAIRGKQVPGRKGQTEK